MLLAKLLCVASQKGKQSKEIEGTSTDGISTDQHSYMHILTSTHRSTYLEVKSGQK